MNFRLLKYEHKMEVLLELFIIEIIFLHSKLCSAQLLGVFFKSVFIQSVFFQNVREFACSKLCKFISVSFLQAFLPHLIIQSDCSRVRTAFLLWCSLATTATTAVILFKSKTYNLGKGYSTKKSENIGSSPLCIFKGH